jgi:hypothetical protein
VGGDGVAEAVHGAGDCVAAPVSCVGGDGVGSVAAGCCMLVGFPEKACVKWYLGLEALQMHTRSIDCL